MNLKKLGIRAASGTVYCLIILICVLIGQYGVLALGILLSVGACIEFAKISHDMTIRNIPTLIIEIAGCITLCFGYLGYTLIIWLALMIGRAIVELYVGSARPLHNLAHSYMSQIYIGVPMSIMVSIGFMFNPMMIMALFILIWINDTGAFLVGSLMGRHKLFERISPKKTWEGFAGGLIFCLIASVLFSVYCNEFFGMDTIDADLGVWIGLGVIVCIFGTWGDLVESMIKRNLQIKDSGNIIPGHGGILDRIDSLLLVLPAVAVYIAVLIYRYL